MAVMISTPTGQNRVDVTERIVLLYLNELKTLTRTANDRVPLLFT